MLLAHEQQQNLSRRSEPCQLKLATGFATSHNGSPTQEELRASWLEPRRQTNLITGQARAQRAVPLQIQTSRSLMDGRDCCQRVAQRSSARSDKVRGPAE